MFVLFVLQHVGFACPVSAVCVCVCVYARLCVCVNACQYADLST